ncbi:hypothetical protein [uncultured Actinomyces sp.]|uniref:hypothetical protein n=1 Tax=uncultured Actinomyces sp. TaxID=249061 RepID=UPI0028DC9E67|nr:hypothetical protein [uncultured Actinomyces sp.]
MGTTRWGLASRNTLALSWPGTHVLTHLTTRALLLPSRAPFSVRTVLIRRENGTCCS